MGPQVDVFVQVQSRDVSAVVACVHSVRDFLKNRGRICVVTAALPLEVRQQLESLGCEFLNEKDVFGFDATAISGSPDARERLFGQFLKWELRRFSQTPTYLVIDANRTLTEPTDLWHGDRQTLFCENRFRFGYLMCFNYFFGQLPYPSSPAISEVQHLNVSVIDEMVAKIQAKYSMHWAQATFTILQQVHGTAFDAGQNYGHYLAIFRPGSFAVQPYPSRSLRCSEERDIRPGDPALRSTSETGLDGDLNGIVRMSTLGFNGRFANQVFQYAYLNSYAKRNGLKAECPPWIGNSLFGHQTTLSENELPIYREDKGETDEMIRLDPQANHKNFELWGYFQNPRHWADDHHEFINSFQPLPFLKKPLDEAVARLRAGNKTLVAIHLRRGDFIGGTTFWQAPEAWYLRWLAQIWPTLPNPVLYVASDDPANVLPHFAGYSPKTTTDLNVTVNGAEFYSDFYVLSQCDVLAISNSTFSFAASMMNQNSRMFVRPNPVREEMTAFDPWTSDVQLRKPEVNAMSIAA